MNAISKAAAVLGSKGGASGHGAAKNRGTEHSRRMLQIRWGNQLDRFWSKVIKAGPDDCWNWIGWKTEFGYGVLRFDGEEQRAHRVSFLIHNGYLNPEKCVLHRCDNPACCNPAHLFEGTKHDNTQDMMSKGRHRTVPHPGESNHSAKLTKEQVVKIRHDYSNGLKNQIQLGREHGVTQSTIWLIVKRKNWKHI